MMIRNKKVTAWLLCAAMLFSDQGVPALASAVPVGDQTIISETGKSAVITATDSNAKPDTDRIEVTLPLQPIEELEWDGDPYIYWNPGNHVQIDLDEMDWIASPSNLAAWWAYDEDATPSNANWMSEGKDSADGLLPTQPVKSLSTAIRKAKRLAEKLDMEEEDIIIYAMNPMEIKEGEAYFLDGKGMTIMAWDGRDYDSDLIFYVNGGQLSLEDVILQPATGVGNESGTSVIQVDDGKVQLGEQVELAGAITLNYQETKETPEWLLEDADEEDQMENGGETDGGAATPSDAEKADAEDAEKPAETEIRKATPSNTGKTASRKEDLDPQMEEAIAPVVELLRDFDGYGPYYLDVKADKDLESIELVRSLYADDTTAEEFMDRFLFSDMTDIRWEMEVYQEVEGTLRKARMAATPMVMDEIEDDADGEILDDRMDPDGVLGDENGSLTRKRLVARLSEGALIYWNPGGAVTVNGESYGAGTDTGGGNASYPVKTWNQALEMVKNSSTGGTILAVQTLTLDSAGAAMEYIGGSDGAAGDGTYIYRFDGDSASGIPVRPVSGTAVFRAEEGVTVQFSDLTFTGGDSTGLDGAQAVEISGGKLVLEDNVKTDTAYLQVDLEKTDNDQEIPVEVCSENVDVTLYFGGINDNLNKRFLDVVVPGGELSAGIENGTMGANDVGEMLLDQITLAKGNQGEGDGIYTWSLRQDGELDDQVANPENLELYTDYYYDAIYLDGQRGNDDWLGASCQYPVKTFARAKELLNQEMETSKEARQKAAEEGKDPSAIAIPTKIYICGTVEITGTENWTLPGYTDYDDTTQIQVEIVSHTANIATDKEGNPVHELPASLVSVSGNEDLTLEDGIVIRNITDVESSNTVEVKEGGTLTLTGNALLTGGRESAGSGSQEETATKGFHISVVGASTSGGASTTVNLDTAWTGAIEKRGIGITASGYNTTVNMKGGHIRKNQSATIDGYTTTNTSGYGAGIVCENAASLVMTGGEISENISSSGGTGVLIGTDSSFVMEKGKIAKNTTLPSRDGFQRYIYGGGVYIQGAESSFTMGKENGDNADCIISENSLYRGPSSFSNSIYGGGIAVSSNAKTFTMYAGTVEKNFVDAGYRIYGYGGGLYVDMACSIQGGVVQENKIAEDSYGYASGGGIYLRQEAGGSRIVKNVSILNNESGSRGGGIYINGGTVYIKNCNIKNNISKSNQGGGIYVSSICYAETTAISGNQGGGIYVSGHFYGRGVQITDNKITGDGGGVYVGSNGIFQITDMPGTEPPTETGASKISGNHATGNGGGVYVAGSSSKGNAYIDMSGTFQNSADGKGNNIYLSRGNVYLLSGKLEQPQNKQEADSYNIYLERQKGDTGKFYLDPKNVLIENSSGGEPNAIYLNSPDSYLTYLSAPGESGNSLPITLNKENFAVGSTVARPVGMLAIELEEIPAFPDNALKAARVGQARINDYTYTCTTASDPSSEYNFHDGSITPIRTQLGGFTKDGLTDLVLVGEGIYLDGEKGDNDNNGRDPEHAVADFATAIEKLETLVKEANLDKDGEGFSPFIYICGPVTVEQAETWDLEYDKVPYAKSQYELYEAQEGRVPELAQVKRFTSFVSAPMVTVKQTGTVTANTLIVNGMKDGVITAEQNIGSPVFDIQGGTLNLNGKAVVKDNYFNLIDVTDGKLNLNGENGTAGSSQLEIRSHGYGVYASGSSEIQMTNGAQIYLENATGASVMKDHSYPTASLDGYFQGIILEKDSRLCMTDSSIIQKNTEGDKRNGVAVAIGNMASSEGEPSLVMSGSTMEGVTYGIGLRPYGAQIQLKDGSKITNIGAGIYNSDLGDACGNITIEMEKSKIDDATWGIYLYDRSDSWDYSDEKEGSVSITLKDSGITVSNIGIEALHRKAYSEISLTGTSFLKGNNSSNSYGIYGGGVKNANQTINLCGDANISDFQTGIWGEYDYSYPDDKSLTIYLKDRSSITNNSQSGIQTGNGKTNIIMMDSSRIASNYTKRNSAGGGGVYCYGFRKQAALWMEDSAVIEKNGDYGVYQRRDDYPVNGGIKVTLTENAKIENHKELDVYLNDAVSELHLKEHSSVGEENKSLDKDSIQLNCPLYLEGTATVNGMIYLKNKDMPIVMTKLVEEGEADGKYRLHLAEGFVGQEVVIPQSEDTRYPEEAENSTVMSTADQLSFFEKAKGDGLAGDEERVLRATQTNIILSGENNVYLSGKGDDNNNGLTPETAVRTFKRAKELLEGDGYFVEGANILISDSTLVQEGDEVWGFDENGTVTNSQTEETWKPVITQYKGASYGTMINVSPTFPQAAKQLLVKNLTIEDITIGGGIGYISNIFSVSSEGNLTLGEGTIIQNVTGGAYSTNGYVLSSRENVTIDGAFIRKVDVNSNQDGRTSEGELITILGGTLTFLDGVIEDSIVRLYVNSEKNAASMIGIMSGGSFFMKGGRIENNSVVSSSGHQYGAATALIEIDQNSTMEWSGGVISNNKVRGHNYGDATGVIIVIGSGTKFIMEGGNLENNIIDQKDGTMPKSALIMIGSDAVISGGTISGNTTTANKGQAIGKYSPVYIDSPNFKLKGGSANITDAIYLADTDSLITLSGQIYQKDRIYTVYLNQTGTEAFGPGSAVVQPDNNWLSDATPYLGNFNVISAPYILDQGQSEQAVGNGNTALQENQCLILMKAVFIDSEKGYDQYDGASPDHAVKTFEQAKKVGQTDGQETNGHYVIYASGPVRVSGEAADAPISWTLPETAYLCRYTGFTVYDKNGVPVSGTGEGGKGYTGELIELGSGANLVLGGEDGGTIHIYGRRGIDSDTYNGDSLILIQEGAVLEIRDALLSRNNNTGTEGGEYEDALSGQGGAVRVEKGGDLIISGGSLTGLNAVSGSAVYVGGTMTLKNAPMIQGDVYLAKRDHARTGGEEGETFIQVETGYQPSGYNETDSGTKLSVRVEDDFNGRKVVQYPKETPPTPAEMEYYQLEDYILSVYDFLQNPADLSELTLQKRQAYFLDGTAGNDDNDGSTPDQALKTLKGLYEKLKNSQDTAGAVVYVVNGVTLEDETVLVNYMYQTDENGAVKRVYKGSYQEKAGNSIPIATQVTFMRYIRPEVAENVEGFETAQTCEGPLFTVTGNGSVTLNGIYLDGGRNGATYLIEDSTGTETRLTAEDCEDAKGPLISVSGENAKLELSQVTDDQITAAGDETNKAIRMRTTLRNNQNLTDKSLEADKEAYVLGELDGKKVYEGSSAGVEILSDATCQLSYTEFSNLSIGQAVTGGTDVYNNGTLSIQANVHVMGSIFLEGLGDEDKAKDTSRYISMGQMGSNWEEPFQVKLRDPYFGRTIADYPDQIQDSSTSSMVGYYILEEVVNDYFRLGIRESDPSVYELTPPPAVYIDGQNGADDYTGDEAERMLGSSPTYPVRTLKKAYELMQNRAVNILYVVDTVEIDGTVSLTNTSYYDTSMEDGAIALQNHLKEVEIRRYVKPVSQDANYQVSSFEDGPLFRIKDGGTLTAAAEEGYSIDLDGHKEARSNPVESSIYRTEKGANALAPLIEVEDGGTLNLEGEGVVLHDNKNITGEETAGFLGLMKKTAEGTEGGAVNNGGTFRFAGAILSENEARKGAGVYQNGSFTIAVSQPTGLLGQEIYLTTERIAAGGDGTGETEETWGDDHVITSEVWLDETFVDGSLDLNMDHAVAGRDVIAYNGYTSVDPQHDRYHLGTTVPENLFLVEDPEYDNILELQDWRVLDVTVPEEIFLAIQGGKNGTTVRDGASPEAELGSPEYSITNNGNYTVKVSLAGFADASAEKGIDQDLYPAMKLVSAEDQVQNDSDLYLAIQGTAGTGSGDGTGTGANPFAGLLETALSGYTTEDDAAIKEMGILDPAEEGRFQFTGYASDSFIARYMDSEFPYEGTEDLSELRKDHYRQKDAVTGETTANKARAMYRMNYRIELAEPRREAGAAGQ